GEDGRPERGNGGAVGVAGGAGRRRGAHRPVHRRPSRGGGFDGRPRVRPLCRPPRRPQRLARGSRPASIAADGGDQGPGRPLRSALRPGGRQPRRLGLLHHPPADRRRNGPADPRCGLAGGLSGGKRPLVGDPLPPRGYAGRAQPPCSADRRLLARPAQPRGPGRGRLACRRPIARRPDGGAADGPDRAGGRRRPAGRGRARPPAGRPARRRRPGERPVLQSRPGGDAGLPEGPGPVTAAPARAEPYAPPTALGFAAPLAVAMLLIYSAAWVLPLAGDAPTAAQGGLIRTLYMPAYVLGFGVFAMAPMRSLEAAVRQPFLIALMAVAVASVFWSIAPDQSARRVFAVLCTTAGGMILAGRFGWAALAEVAAAAFAILAVAALIAALAVPSIGVMSEIFPGAWRGLWPEKNALGGNMALGFVCLSAAAVLNPRRAWLWWGFAGLALFLVLMSTSKTSLVSLLLGAATLAFVGLLRLGPAAKVAMVWLAVVGLTIAA